MIEWERANRMGRAGAALMRVIEKLGEECSRRRCMDRAAPRLARIELGLERPDEEVVWADDGAI